jgi:hypothetical protein
VIRFSAVPVEYAGSSPNAPPPPHDRTRGGRVCRKAAALQCISRVAMALRGGSAAARSRRRSSGRHCAVCSRRNPRRMCIHRCRSVRPLRSVAGPCRNIRSSVGVAVPWPWCPVRSAQIIANRSSNPNGEFPSIRDIYPSAFSGSFMLSFRRSSTIDERTWATLWCGISTLLTMSERLLRSRSTAFNK